VKTYLGLALTLLLLACGGGDTGARPTLEKLRGQWVVINYWAQWCKPCAREIPELNALDRQYSQVTVLGVNYDGASGKDLEKQVQKLGVEFHILEADPAEQLGVSRPVVLPTTLILNPSGAVVTTLVGPQTLASLARATGQASSDPPQQ